MGTTNDDGMVSSKPPVKTDKPVKDSDAQDWYRRFRPRRLKDVIGQPDAVNVLTAKLRDGFPHTILLHGPSGVGKTTIARVLCGKLGCGDADFFEINCASMEEPIKTIRGVERGTKLSPRNGTCRIWYYDEIQSLSRAGFAQQSMLKMLEDVPPHVYHILATTDPQKLNPAIRTRCTQIALRSLTAKELEETVRAVAAKAKVEPSEAVVDRIVECACGSARQAIVLLQQVAGLEEEQQLSALEPPAANKAAFELVKLLLYKKPSWEAVRAFLEELGEREEPETLRRLILACARKELLKKGGNHSRAGSIIEYFKSPFYDTPYALLAGAAWEVLRSE